MGVARFRRARVLTRRARQDRSTLFVVLGVDFRCNRTWPVVPLFHGDRGSRWRSSVFDPPSYQPWRRNADRHDVRRDGRTLCRFQAPGQQPFPCYVSARSDPCFREVTRDAAPRWLKQLLIAAR